jgi:FtsX-like permease family
MCLMVPCAVGTVAVSTGAAAFSPAPSTAGTATHNLILRPDVSRTVNDLVEEARQTFGEVEVTLVSKSKRLPGTTSELTFDVLPQRKVFGGTPILVQRGRLPLKSDEVGLSSGVLDALRAIDNPKTDIGDRVQIGDVSATLVAIVQDPASFASDIAIRGPGGRATPDFAMVLVKGADDTVMTFIGTRGGAFERFADTERRRDLTIGIILGIGLFVLLFVAVLSSVSFTVLAASHAREYGVMHAVGATSSDVRRIVILTAMLIGLCASVVGLAIGILGSVVLRPSLTRLIGHDVVSWSVSPLLLMPVPIMTIAAAIGASLRPARLIGRTSARSLLAGSIVSLTVRRSADRIAVVSAAAVGVLFFAIAKSQSDVLAAITPVVALVSFMGGSLLCIRWFLTFGVKRGPLVELVGRDAVRNNRRTRSAIAALAVIATVPATIAVISAADDERLARLPKNLPENMVLLVSESWAFQGKASAETININKLQQAKRRLRAQFPSADMVDVFVAVKGNNKEALDPIRTSRPIPRSENGFSEEPAWIETDALRTFFNLPAPTSDAQARSNVKAPVAINGWAMDRDNSFLPEPAAIPNNRAISSTWLAPQVVSTNSWNAVQIGVLMRTDTPVDTDTARTLYRTVAGDAVVEVSRDEVPDQSARTRVALGAILLGWLVTGVVMALVREESKTTAHQLHTIGASRRHITRIDALAASLLVAVALIGAIVVAYRLRTPMPFVVPIQLAWLTTGLLFGAAATGLIRRKN